MNEENVQGQGAALGTIIVFTDRMEELARFYREGLEIGPYESSPGHLGCRVGTVYFGFDQVEEARGGGSPGVTMWFTVDDIEETYRRLLEMGAESRYPPTKKPWGAILAAVTDPDGNMLGLSQRGA